MSDTAVSVVLVHPDVAPGQARHAMQRQVLPACDAMFARGVKRVRMTLQDEEDDKTIKQRGFYHKVVLTCIAEQAKPGGRRYDMAVWKEYYRARFLGFKWVVHTNPVSGRKVPHKVRVSTEDLGIRRYSKLIDEVMADAATEHGVEFPPDQSWENYQP